MSEFLGEDYLLENESARLLYDYIKDLPIIDPHNHIDLREILDNRGWRDIWEVEGATDHYVWELMRRCGVEEKFITGSASNREKWEKLADIFPKLAGNPVYEWVHLDLLRRFGIKKLICSETAEDIWNETKKKLEDENMKQKSLLRNMKIEMMCTTDDPISELDLHKRAKSEVEATRILPTWRPDRLMNVEKNDWREYVVHFTEKMNEDPFSFEAFLSAISRSHDNFGEYGCVVSDHGVENPTSRWVRKERISKIYEKAIEGRPLGKDEVEDFKAYMLMFFGILDSEKDWIMQIHIGAVRDYRLSLFKNLGPDSGGDISTNMIDLAEGLRCFLNEFDGKLRIILYILDPTHLPTITTIARAFPNVNIGAAWWFNDSPFGMNLHLEYISSVDLLSRFTGMVTDSRKLMSFGSRTEMFRRVVANLLGKMVERGQIPVDVAKDLAFTVSYKNLQDLFLT